MAFLRSFLSARVARGHRLHAAAVRSAVACLAVALAGCAGGPPSGPAAGGASGGIEVFGTVDAGMARVR